MRSKHSRIDPLARVGSSKRGRFAPKLPATEIGQRAAQRIAQSFPRSGVQGLARGPCKGSSAMNSEVEQEVRRAWSAAKRTVRVYSRDPCQSNAEFVRLAFLRLRRTREREFVSKMSLRPEGTCVSEQQWNKICGQCRDTFVSYLGRSDTPCGACPVKELDRSDFGHVTLPEPLSRHAAKAS